MPPSVTAKMTEKWELRVCPRWQTRDQTAEGKRAVKSVMTAAVESLILETASVC